MNVQSRSIECSSKFGFLMTQTFNKLDGRLCLRTPIVLLDKMLIYLHFTVNAILCCNTQRTEVANIWADFGRFQKNLTDFNRFQQISKDFRRFQ